MGFLLKKRVSRLMLLLFFFLLMISVPAVKAVETHLTLNTFTGPPLSTKDHKGLYDRIIIEGFRRIGIKVSISHLPAERSITNANTGFDDGDFVRISGLDILYPNLIKVPEKITD